MRTSSADRLLRVWEDTQDAHPLDQARGLLVAAWPECDSASWARLPIGTRDARLLDVHEAWFGTGFQTTAECGACGTRLESDFPVSAIRVEPVAQGSVHTLRHGSDVIEFRLPTSEDLLELEAVEDPNEAQETLLRRCVAGWGSVGPSPPVRIPATLAALLDAEMARLDPGADLRIRLRCASCGNEQVTVFDIVAYLREELDEWAQRLLADVHVLARAYGWSEHEILALSAVRRTHYIEMVCA
jgi:hypothetical protein